MSTSPPQGQLDVRSESNLKPLPTEEGMYHYTQVLIFILDESMFSSPPQGQPVDLKSESNLTSKQNIPPLPIEEGMYINFSCFILDQSMSTSPPQGQLGVKSEGNLRPGQNVPLPHSEGMVQMLSYISSN